MPLDDDFEALHRKLWELHQLAMAIRGRVFDPEAAELAVAIEECRTDLANLRLKVHSVKEQLE